MKMCDVGIVSEPFGIVLVVETLLVVFSKKKPSILV